MFSPIQKKSDWTRQGSLKSNVNFSFCGDVTSISIRERKRYGQDSDEAKKIEYYLVIEDGYGWQCSFFRQGLELEKAQAIAAKIPYGRTINITGDVAVRKGNTYFNAKTFLNPDGTDILLLGWQKNEEN